MTTNNENIRDIKELVTLDTYQGMSDAEINLLFEYRLHMALEQQRMQMENDAIVVCANEMVSNANAGMQQAISMLQSIVERKPMLTSVEE